MPRAGPVAARTGRFERICVFPTGPRSLGSGARAGLFCAAQPARTDAQWGGELQPPAGEAGHTAPLRLIALVAQREPFAACAPGDHCAQACECGDALLMSLAGRSLTGMDSENWIVATDSGSYWGRSWGAEGVTFVRANAHQYSSRAQAASKIAELAASGDERAYHVEQIPSGRRYRY